MTLDNIKDDKGFLLVDALVSFGLLTSLLLVALPFFIELFHIRDQAKSEVELSRALYEEALFWTRQEVESDWLSGSERLNSAAGKFSIIIAGEGGNEKKVEIQSISWQE